MLYLAEFLVLTLQLLLVNPVALHFRHGALVEKVEDRAVNFWAKVVVVLENLKLARCYVTVGTFARRGLSSTAKTLRSLNGVRGCKY